MKLVEILAEKMNVWPESTVYYAQDTCGLILPWTLKPKFDGEEWVGDCEDDDENIGIDQNTEAFSYNLDLASDWDEALVTKEMWLAEKGGDGTQTISSCGDEGGGGKMKLAEFLLKSVPEYNGHKQLEINDISLSTLKQILSELEEEDRKHMYAMKIYEDGSGTIEQLDYWDKGEHHLGHLDRTILGFTICDWCGE